MRTGQTIRYLTQIADNKLVSKQAIKEAFIPAPYFEPWIGSNYDNTRILVMSESTYDWIGEDGVEYTPQPDHAVTGVPWQIEHFGTERNYFTAVIRATCGEKSPTKARMYEVWNDFAYTPYIQSSVGFGPSAKPSSEHWKEAKQHFLNLIERLRPTKVIVTGLVMWNAMPDCHLKLVNELQAYRLDDGSLVWCLAIPHPSSRTSGKGFAWESIATSIRLFRGTEFPTH